MTQPGRRGRSRGRRSRAAGKGIWPRLRDLVNEPLGLSPPPPSAWARHRAAVSRAAIAAGIAVVAAGGFGAREGAAASAGPAFAVAARRAAARFGAAARAPRRRPPRPWRPPASTRSPRPRGSKPPAASRWCATAARAGRTRLSSTCRRRSACACRRRPIARLVEKSRFGLLPRIGADGARPAEIYARPVVQSPRAKAAARVAILVGGLGIDAAATAAAISRLPAAISLGFAPYGGDLERDAARAREAGHEILLQAPMEPIAATTLPGPHTLTADASEAENIQSLHWLMATIRRLFCRHELSRGQADRGRARAFAPILSEINARGLAYIDDGSSPRSLAREIAPTLGLPATVADVVLDASPTPEAIEAALARLEAWPGVRRAQLGSPPHCPSAWSGSRVGRPGWRRAASRSCPSRR